MSSPSSTPAAPSGIVWSRWLNALGPLLALLVVWVGFAVLETSRGDSGAALWKARIFSPLAIEQIVQQTVVVGIAAIGMTLIIIAGGIDLSVGSAIALTSVIGAWLMQQHQCGPLATIAGALAGGAVCGVVVAFLVVQLGHLPFIATLGTLLVFRGAAKLLAQAQPINVEAEWIAWWLTSLPDDKKWMLIPPGGWLMLGLAGIVAALLRYTVVGRHIFAVGSNAQTAVLCGVPVARIKYVVYGLGGVFAAISGLMLVSYQAQGDPTGAQGLELDIIAAVVIGGGSLSGGAGSVFGALVGALIMTVIRVGCSLNSIEASTTQIVTGLIILIAVSIDRLRHRTRD